MRPNFFYLELVQRAVHCKLGNLFQEKLPACSEILSHPTALCEVAREARAWLKRKHQHLLNLGRESKR